MKHKCNLCGDEIKTTFLEKLEGTIIKTGNGENSKKIYICSSCQKKHKENLKEKISG
jgi:gluconate kinase